MSSPVATRARSLAQVVAQERTAHAAANKTTGAIDKLMQKPAPFSGIFRTYTPDDPDNGEKLPPEGNIVQASVPVLMKDFALALTPFLNLAAAKDWANGYARADLVVDGTLIYESVPVAHLLFLEHQVDDIAAFIGSLQVRSAEEVWTLDKDTGLYRSEPSWTNRYKRREVPLVLHPGNEHHAPNVKSVIDEVHEGKWTTVKTSGAISAVEKRAWMERVLKLKQAIHAARVQADQQLTEEFAVGEAIFRYLQFV